MSDEGEGHWSEAIWSTHLGGIHISIVLPILLFFFAGMSFWVTVVWGVVSFVTHQSGFGLWGYMLRMRLRIGKLVHGASRRRSNRIAKIKRKLGSNQ